MRHAIETTDSKAAHDVDVDAIVARYTALGREERRGKKRRGRARTALVAIAAVGGGTAAWVYGGLASEWLAGASSALLERVVPATDDVVRALREQVSSELERLDAERAELAAERMRYNERSAALERELQAFAERHSDVERQQAALAAQSAELRLALAAVEADRSALLASAEVSDAAVERELAAIAEQRRDLEERSAAFSMRGRELSNELALLEQQRDELENARAIMEQERRQLEALIEDTARAAGKTSLVADPELDPTLGPIFANAVEAPALDEMRGGVQLANGMNIAIGLTRSASINGVEQYSSSLRLDDLAAGIGSAAALDGLGVNVIQNGAGNFIAPEVLDGLSSGFGTIIQNTLDNQEIHTLSTYDIAISNVGSAIRDIAAGQALSDSLLLTR